MQQKIKLPSPYKMILSFKFPNLFFVQNYHP